MAAPKLVFVTGFKELDAKLESLEPKIQKKFVRGALRKGGKRLTQEAQRIIRQEARDTGALEKSVKVLSLKRSRKRVGIAVMPKREVLFTQYAARHEGKKPHPAKDETEPYYYAASIEFGTETQPAVKPFRRALYDNAKVYQAYFIGDVKQFIAENKVTTKISKAEGYTGKKFKK